MTNVLAKGVLSCLAPTRPESQTDRPTEMHVPSEKTNVSFVVCRSAQAGKGEGPHTAGPLWAVLQKNIEPRTACLVCRRGLLVVTRFAPG